jgi:hypothetical protein
MLTTEKRHGKLQIVFHHKAELKKKTSILWDREAELSRASILCHWKAELSEQGEHAWELRG